MSFWTTTWLRDSHWCEDQFVFTQVSMMEPMVEKPQRNMGEKQLGFCLGLG